MKRVHSILCILLLIAIGIAPLGSLYALKSTIPLLSSSITTDIKVLFALAQKNLYLPCKEKLLFARSLTHLSHISGFSELFLTCIQARISQNKNLFKGAYYQLQRALELHDQGAIINGLNIYISYEDVGKEFDIVTDRFWIECKHVSWPWIIQSPCAFNKIKEQLIEQNHIVNAYNKHQKSSNDPIIYQLSSWSTLPVELKKFLVSHNISWHVNNSCQS